MKFYKIYWIWVVLWVMPFHALLAEIITTGDFQIIAEKIDAANAEVLVIFDVDDVLLHPQDHILKVEHKQHVENFKNDLKKRYSAQEAEEFDSLIMSQREAEPVDHRFIHLIHTLHERGVKVLSLTHCFSGAWGKIRSLAAWRAGELQKLGYHFEHSWPGLKEKVFSSLGSHDPKRFPVFKEGVILTCRISKGRVLKAFLDYAGAAPKRIIFVDDKRKNLHAVEEMARGKGIEFLGIEYMPPQCAHPLNAKRAALQFEMLEKEKRWVGDAEADQILLARASAEK